MHKSALRLTHRLTVLISCLPLSSCLWLIRPGGDFHEYKPPPAPIYYKLKAWAAHPDKKDPADLVPKGSGLRNEQARAGADVFFVHGTTFISRSGWNGPVDDKGINAKTNEHIRNMASVFNCCARVFAPRYRQATIYTFIDESGNGMKALDFAYGDVLRAFDYFMENRGKGLQGTRRPFILAGHSQGGVMIRRLLRDRIDASPFRRDMVAAYAVGVAVKPDQYRSIPPCESPKQTGCFLSWVTVGENSKLRLFRERHRGTVCSNPLTWTRKREPVPASANPGGVHENFNRIDPFIVGARCEDGLLRVTRPGKSGYDGGWDDNYHVLDYNLFYLSIRRNLRERLKAMK